MSDKILNWTVSVAGALILASGSAALGYSAAPMAPEQSRPASVHLVCHGEDACELDWHDGAWWGRQAAGHGPDQASATGQGPGPWVRLSR